MQLYVVRRLIQAFFTVFGVMLITFILFRMIAGDVSASFVNLKLGLAARQAFYEKHKLDRPVLFNVHRRLALEDRTRGEHVFSVFDEGGSRLAVDLQLHLAPSEAGGPHGAPPPLKIVSRFQFRASQDTPLTDMTEGKPYIPKPGVPAPAGPSPGAQRPDEKVPSILIAMSSGDRLSIPLQGIESLGDLIQAVNDHPGNRGKIVARLSHWSLAKIFDSQFFWHIVEGVTFSGRSYATDQTVLEIIGERAKFSLAITVPALALGWLLAMLISCFVAYYRETWIDRVGVLLAVLGMCIPYLAYMLLGQWVMFKIAPEVAVGLAHPANIYMPVLIAVAAGLGMSVRFYRTVILDEIYRDYVRTARAKGVPLRSILFVHVLKNCMLPILTNVISMIPFLIMGSLLLERFFGIPGLGDLMLTSITSRDVPIITGLVFLTSVLYVISLVITDVLYAVFDPRIRLQ